MFHTGDLTSGITKAVQESKLVACFVRADDDEASEVWESQWLGESPDEQTSQSLGELISAKAVILRLGFGTQEANFLNAFCQITDAPTLVIIHNGRVLEKIPGDVTREEFLARIAKATGLELRSSEETRASSSTSQETQTRASTTAAQETQTRASTTAAQETQTRASTTAAQETQASTTVPQPESSPAAASHPPATDMQNLFPDRAQRHEAEYQRQAAAEKAERAARAQARRKEAEEAQSANPSTSSEKNRARHDWLVQQKQRKDEAKREKERILAQIEADKANRKARAQEAKNPPPPSTDAGPSTSLSASSKRRMGAAGLCSLQVRLFDGSSIKGRFEPTATLAKHVREWILSTASTADQPIAQTPYTFRQILAPLPNRVIEVGEEHKSLLDLDLAPTATLVLVPVRGAADAYSHGSDTYVGSAWNLASGVVGGVWGVARSALGYVPGIGSSSGATGASSSSSSSTSPSSSMIEEQGVSRKGKGIATLADGSASTSSLQNEFYNGNSLGFESRKDDDADDAGRHAGPSSARNRSRDDEARESS